MRALTIVALLLAGCAIRSEVPPREAAQLVLWSGDQGCSRAPDLAYGIPCLEHDLSYGAGGTERDRFVADAELLRDLALWGVPEPIAVVYYLGVRLLGWCCWEYRPERTRGPGQLVARLPLLDPAARGGSTDLRPRVSADPLADDGTGGHPAAPCGLEE